MQRGVRWSIGGAFGVICCMLSSNAGAAVPRPGAEVWRQQGLPLTSTDAGPKYGFGGCVAISGNAIAVGDTTAFEGRGAVFVFTREGSVWSQQGAGLMLPDAAAGDALGCPCALSGDTLIAGAQQRSGVYIFSSTSGTWGDAQALSAEGAEPGWTPVAVAIHGDHAVASKIYVGDTMSRAMAFVYARQGTSWTQSEPTIHPENPQSAFGDMLALTDTTMVFGAPYQNGGAVFSRSWVGDHWSDDASILEQPGSTPAMGFGSGLAASGDTLLVHGLYRVGLNDPRPAVYPFQRSAGGWVPQGEPIQSSDNIAVGMFMALSGNAAVFAGFGYAQFFSRTGAQWAQRPPTLSGHWSQPFGRSSTFGNAVGIDGQYAIIGETGVIPETEVDVARAGAAHVYSEACDDDECPPGAYCAEGTCYAHCSTTSDCPAASQCDARHVCSGGPDQGSGGAASLAGAAGTAGGDVFEAGAGANTAGDSASTVGGSSGAAGELVTIGGSAADSSVAGGTCAACGSAAGAPDNNEESAAGCGCRLATNPRARTGQLALGVLALLLYRARRTRRSAAARRRLDCAANSCTRASRSSA